DVLRLDPRSRRPEESRLPDGLGPRRRLPRRSKDGFRGCGDHRDSFRRTALMTDGRIGSLCGKHSQTRGIPSPGGETVREKHPGIVWIVAAGALIGLTFLGVLFVPLKECPICQEVDAEFAEMGIDPRAMKTSPLCRLCGGRLEKISLLKLWK